MSGRSYLSNAHTHTRYCDGKNTVQEMAEAAIRLGFVSLGFSGHGAQGFDPLYSMDGGRQKAYLAELRALQARHRGVMGGERKDAPVAEADASQSERPDREQGSQYKEEHVSHVILSEAKNLPGQAIQRSKDPPGAQDDNKGLRCEHWDRENLPRIWIGIEQDALVPKEQKKKNRETVDYILGSTHYACRDFHGQCVPVDGGVQLLTEYIKEVHAGDALAMAQAYFDGHVRMLLEDRPDIIGHFDVVCKNARLYHIFDPEGKPYRKMAMNALEAVMASGGVLEVNTGGMAREPLLKEPYPSRELLGAWREMGGEVTITSDCHDAGFLDYAFKETFLALHGMGYKSIFRLGIGDTLWEVVDL